MTHGVRRSIRAIMAAESKTSVGPAHKMVENAWFKIEKCQDGRCHRAINVAMFRVGQVTRNSHVDLDLDRDLDLACVHVNASHSEAVLLC